ncbi:hypothetical protein V5O48_017920 [Marasmius crinis-equi]|uniref:Uncharacterized protein n=1 Tax=Marasmius crinis-equi TaxID=585013 RepID=A0ABR3EML8_9AGAR
MGTRLNDMLNLLFALFMVVACTQPLVQASSKRYIIEMDDENSLFARDGASVHKRFYDTLNLEAIVYSVNREFHSPGLFVGMSLTLENPSDLLKLSSIPGVKSIRPSQIIQGPPYDPFQFPPRRSIYRSVCRPPEEDPNAAARFEGYAPAMNVSGTASSRQVSGIDKLHAQGITGNGIKIAVIDTGIDYNHPALGGGFGPGHKVVGGFDFVGDIDGEINPDDDPFDMCNGHGTHVAGTIAADPNNPFGVTGVAYSSTLSAYRIFGCGGQATDDRRDQPVILLAGMLRAVEDGNDILSMSLGEPGGWSSSTLDVVASRIAATGKIVVVAAGNQGADGAWFASSPSSGAGVLSVASLDSPVVPLQSAQVGGAEHDPIVYYDILPLTNRTNPIPIYVTSNNTADGEDACRPFGDETPNLGDFIVITRDSPKTSGCKRRTKLENIFDKGGKLVLFYENDGGFDSINARTEQVGDLSVSLIQRADGEFLVQQWIEGKDVTLTFPQRGGVVQFNDPKGGLISKFSSYGPSFDFQFKPSFAAPGGNILSTYPTAFGSYKILSGTSMATPFAAGAAALLLEAKGKSSEVARGAISIFETNSVGVPVSKDGNRLQTLSQQGAGLVNVFDAVQSTTIVSPGELILNDTANFKGEQTFTVKNTGSSSKSYTLKHVPAGTAITVNGSSIFPAPGPVPLSDASAGVVLSTSSFSLGAGESQTITATFSPPQGLNAENYPVYGGYIEVNTDGETHHVSYQGLAASLKDKKILDEGNSWSSFITLPAVVGNDGQQQTGPANFTMDPGSGAPLILWRFGFGTAKSEVNLVDASNGNSTDVVGTVYSDEYVRRDFLFLIQNATLSTGLFANGSRIPDGTYRLNIRALKVTGDPAKDEDWDSWFSPIMGLSSVNSSSN